MSRGWKIGIGVFAVVVALNVALAAVDRVAGGTPGGPRSSSYATAATGLAGYAELLSRRGHDIVRTRVPAAEATLDPRSTAVLLDAQSVSPKDLGTLGEFLDAGGRLVAGGEDPAWLNDLLEDPLTWSPEGVVNGRVLATQPEVKGVRRVAVRGNGGSWADTGGGRALYGDPRHTLLSYADVGRGRLVMLADASPLQNELLGELDNAQLGLGVAGPRRRVLFLESYHGYARASGLHAIPARWWTAIALAALAGIVFMFARGRRLGPPEAEDRELPPSRREYVDSVAGILARTRRPDQALEPLRARVALGPLRDDADVLAAGRALAEHERRRA